MSGVQVTVKTINVDKVVDAFLRTATNARGLLKQEMLALGVILTARVQNNRLQGQSLNQRSGDLVTSIHPEVVESSSDISVFVGTNLKYGAIHEKGFTGVVSVREHYRTVKQAWGKPIAPVQARVRAHQMTMRMPQRAFLAPELEAFQPTLVRRLTKLATTMAEVQR